MNLLNEKWMPVRRSNGERDWVAPDQLSDPDILAFDADRADFNGALAQFAIGLLQTTTPVEMTGQWKQYLRSPPDRETLQSWFAPVAGAFEFAGDGARYMQDCSLRAGDGTENSIGALLIESPGENTQRNNSDHFIKRGQVDALCPACAVTALTTLQINAPAGGAGIRTGLRGGGPLTTLLLSQPPRSLWHDLWLNVSERSQFLARGGDANTSDAFRTFPWLADISAIQKAGGETVPAMVHPHHVFWAMPRRIRLDLETVVAGCCGICGRHSEGLIRRYVTKNLGLNYKGPWDHPLSPYYETKEGWLPLHPQPGGLGYRHWLAWVLGQQTDKKHQRPAEILSRAMNLAGLDLGINLSIWAFGYDMDKMKARCWYESTLPLYGLAGCGKDGLESLRDAVSTWLAAAELVASFLRGAIKDAWFDLDARGDFSAVDASFWGRTEGVFYRQLRSAIETLLADETAEINDLATRERWRALLEKAASNLFDDEFVGTGQIERQKPARVAAAFKQLKRNLNGPKLRKELRLPDPEPPPAKAAAKGKSTKKTAVTTE